jgi:SAM-dependent methyltransferase
MISISEKVEKGTLDELSFHFAPHIVLFTALKLGIFPAVASGPGSITSIAGAIDCSPRGVRMLLDCLAAMELLNKQDEQYTLNDLSRRYFLRDSEDYIGNIFACCDEMLKLWRTLPEGVRTGKPTLSILDKEEKRRLTLLTVDGLFQAHKAVAWKLADRVMNDSFLTRAAVVTILDVASGSAVWSIPFALKCSSGQVTAVDFTPVLDIARKYVRRFGVEDRYTFSDGDIREVDFGADKYDFVLLGHICHSEGANWSQGLIEKCFRALKADGRLLIMDYVTDEERKTELIPLLVALNALLGTDEGDTFCFSDYERWLIETGFTDVQSLHIEGHSPVILGVKRKNGREKLFSSHA